MICTELNIYVMQYREQKERSLQPVSIYKGIQGNGNFSEPYLLLRSRYTFREQYGTRGWMVCHRHLLQF